MEWEPLDYHQQHLAESIEEACKILTGTTSSTKTNVQALSLVPRQPHRMTAKESRAFSAALRNNDTLIELRIEEIKIGLAEILNIACAIDAHPKLERFSTFDCGLGDDGGGILTQCATRLQDLAIEKDTVTLTRGLFLPDWMADFHHLQILSLRENAIDDHGARTLVQEFSRNPHLLEVDLSSNAITAVGATYISKWLGQHEAVRILNMSWNSLREEGAVALSFGLKRNKSLDVLILNGCRIGDQGAIALSSAARRHASLQLFMVEDNRIGATGTMAISEAFQQNHTLDCMGLSWNPVSDVGVLAIGQGISHTCYLYLDHCNLGNLGAILLSQALATNTSLVEVNLGDNEIGLEGAKALACAMEDNSTVETLLLGGNKLTDEGAHLFRNMLRDRNMSLAALELDYLYHNIQQEVNVYLEMNSSGRRHALNNAFPLALWSNVLFKTNSNASLLFNFLREKPEVFR